MVQACHGGMWVATSLTRARAAYAKALCSRFSAFFSTKRHSLARMPAMRGRRGFFIFLARFWLFLIFFAGSSVATAETIPSTISGYICNDGDSAAIIRAAVQQDPKYLSQNLIVGAVVEFSGLYYSGVYDRWVCNVKFIVSDGYITPWHGPVSADVNYTCPSTGGWTLSSDEQTCSRCPDTNLPILTPEGACVGLPDKGAGESCGESPGSSGSPNPIPPQ